MNESSHKSAGDTNSLWIIHGTFNAPDQEGPRKWYQFDPKHRKNFCDKLQACLQDGHMRGSLWRPEHLIDGDTFSWSGDNDHDERLKAGRKLCDRIVTVTSRDPTARMHFIAYSHGGNVVLKAVELYHQHLRNQGARIFTRLQNAIDHGDDAEAAAEDAVRREFPEITGPLPQPWVDELTEFCRRGLEKRSSGKRLYRRMQPDTTRMLLFQRAWASWPQANRLGRVVFLGTPFYR